ncbi:MAG: zinc-ribbon domain-containing protein [Anaerolineae bacterium]|nr:zinc-ribbon domain-containing protein [Anaerolineae bacterium]
MSRCANCGKENDPGALYCGQCGKSLSDNQPITRTPENELLDEDTAGMEKSDLVNEKSLSDLFKNDFANPSPPVAPLSAVKGETKPEPLQPPSFKTDSFATLNVVASSIPEVFCEVCKSELHSKDDKFCSNCGAPQQQNLEKCRSCKTPLIPGAQFCHYCGAPVVAVPQVSLHMANNDLVFKIPPRAEVFTIGRNVPQQNNFVDLDLGPYGQRRVSRQHARFVLKENKWYLEDLNSKAGTRIFNDRLAPFEPKPVEDNMIVFFAELKFKISMN